MQLKARYLTKDELEVIHHDNPNQADKYYSLKKFKYFDQFDESDKDKLPTGLSYCSTCNMLRPPRAFHCNACGVCISVHDHHCPWVGTCIGQRNVRYFIKFLALTALHCLYTAIICSITSRRTAPKHVEGEKPDQLVVWR